MFWWDCWRHWRSWCLKTMMIKWDRSRCNILRCLPSQWRGSCCCQARKLSLSINEETRKSNHQKDKMRIYYISGTVLALVGWTLLSLSRMSRWEFGREVGGMNWNQCKMRGKDYLDLKNKKCFFFPGLCPGGPGSQLHHLWWRSWRRCQGVWLSS